MLGRDLLVAPIVKKGDVSRRVYLPKDEWVHVFTGKEYGGGYCTVDAPIGFPPVFVRKNSEVKDRIIDSVNI